VVKNYIHDLDQNMWDNVPIWFEKKESEELSNFLKDKQHQHDKSGLFNIMRAKLDNCKEIRYQYARNYLPSRYIEQFTNPKVYYVAVDYKVHKQNKYFINGVNYFFIVLVLQDRQWKIVFTPLVPVSSIIDDGYGFGTEDEKTFDKRRLSFQFE
jgi:hypothetical protein